MKNNTRYSNVHSYRVSAKTRYFLQMAALLLSSSTILSAADLVISNSQSSSMTISAGGTVTVDKFIFGDTGTRTATFNVTTNTTNPGTLQILAGLDATGYLGTAGINEGLAFRTNVSTGTAEQTWNIGGPNGANNNFDYGVKIAALTSGSTYVTNTFTLNGNVIKTGSGMLVLCATTVTGSGNIVVNEGSLRLNAGQSSALTILGGAGQGNITINNGASLSIYKNSGSMLLSRDIILNGSNVVYIASGGPGTGSLSIDSNITVNGTSTFDLSTVWITNPTQTLNGSLLGTGTIVIVRKGSYAASLAFTSSQNFGGNIVMNSSDSLTFGSTSTIGGLIVNAGTVNILGSLITDNLTLTNGSNVSATTGIFANAQGTINIGSAANETAKSAGILDTPTISSTTTALGSLQFNHTATNATPYFFTRDGTSNGESITIGGSVNVVITNGTTVFTGANTYTGGTTINGGILQIGDGGSLGTGNVINNAALVFNRSDTYKLTQNITGTGITTVTAGGLELCSGITGNLVIGNGATLAAGGGGVVGTLSFEGGSTFVAGATSLHVDGTLTHSGTVTVNLSDAFFTANNTAGTYDILTYSQKMGAGSFSLDTTLLGGNAATRLEYTLLAPTSTALKVAISGSIADLIWAGTTTNNTWQLKSGATNWTGHATDNQFYTADNVTFSNAGENKTVNIIGTVTPDNITFTHTAGNDYTFTGTGTIAMVAGTTFAHTGSGTTTFTTAGHTFSNVTVTGGELILEESATILGDVTVENGILQLGTINHQIGVKGDQFTMSSGQKIIINDGGLVKAYGATWGNSNEYNTPLFSSPGIQIEVNDGGTLETSTHGLAGMIYTNVPDITINAGGRWEMLGPQYVTNVTLNGGTISGAGALQIANESTIITVSGTTASTIEASVNLTYAASTWYITNATGDAAPDLIISGTVTGSYALNKTGSGTMLLTGNNTNTGAVNVNGGTLLINGDQSAATGVVTVASGATLGGNGIIGGEILVKNGGTLSPGNSPGTLTVNNNVTLEAGAIFLVEIDSATSYDRLTLLGKTLTLNDGVELQIALNGSLAVSDQLVIATGYSSLIGVGVFGDSITSGGVTFGIDYTGGSITLSVMAIPEPSTYGLLAGGLVLAGAVTFRRRKRVG